MLVVGAPVADVRAAPAWEKGVCKQDWLLQGSAGDTGAQGLAPTAKPPVNSFTYFPQDELKVHPASPLGRKRMESRPDRCSDYPAAPLGAGGLVRTERGCGRCAAEVLPRRGMTTQTPAGRSAPSGVPATADIWRGDTGAAQRFTRCSPGRPAESATSARSPLGKANNTKQERGTRRREADRRSPRLNCCRAAPASPRGRPVTFLDPMNVRYGSAVAGS
jgi:hypothetical protein